MTTPTAETMSIGLLAFALLSWFLHRHLDNFIMTWQTLLIYRDSAIWTTLSWHGNPAHLRGLCKNSCQPRHRRQLPIPPGRYKKYAAVWGYSATRIASNKMHLDKTVFHLLSICTLTLNWPFPFSVSGDKSYCLDNFLCQPHNPANAHIKNWLPATYC